MPLGPLQEPLGGEKPTPPETPTQGSGRPHRGAERLGWRAFNCGIEEWPLAGLISRSRRVRFTLPQPFNVTKIVTLTHLDKPETNQRFRAPRVTPSSLPRSGVRDLTGKAVELTERDRQTIRAVVADRRGIDARLLEIESQIQALMDERSELKRQRLTNAQLAEKFGVCTSTIHYIVHGRL